MRRDAYRYAKKLGRSDQICRQFATYYVPRGMSIPDAYLLYIGFPLLQSLGLA